MAHYNGIHPIFSKIDQAMLFSIDTIGSQVVDFADKATIEAEAACNIKSSGYTVLFTPGVGLDIVMTFLMMSDKSAIILLSIPTFTELGKEGYLKHLVETIKEAINNNKGEK